MPSETEGDDLVLALDVGTRKVLALVGRRSPAGLEIVGYASQEHRARPMRDGQVQAVAEVGKAVAGVLAGLADQGFSPFRKAAVAVAGRELKVYRATAKRRRSGGTPVTAEECSRLERRALDEAGRRMEEDRARMDRPGAFFGVGYDVVSRKVDGAQVDDLAGFSGSELSVECLVAFLPASSLDGLAAVMESAGLETSCLTLEPIAALEAVVPASLRHLNLALVDIGAGTSDFAVVRRGSVAGYGMIPYAGDELTEKIGDHFLVDFQTAEIIKRSAPGPEGLEFEDLLGRSRRVHAAERDEVLASHLEALATAISRKIETLNGGPPRAVFLVGGASQTQGLGPRIARALSMREEDVGVLYPSKTQDMVDKTGKLRGPEAVTGLGILRLGAEGRGLGLFPASVNGRRIRVVHVGGQVTAGDALAAAGIPRESLDSRSAEPLRFVVNGKERVLEARRGASASVLVNGKPVPTASPLPRDASVQFSQEGGEENPPPRLRDILGEAPEVRYTLNGQPGRLRPRFLVHGEPAQPDAFVRDGDVLSKEEGPTIALALAAAGLSALGREGDQWRARLNGVETVRPWEPCLLLNGKTCRPGDRFQDGDVLEATAKLPSPRIRDLMENQPRQGRGLRLTVNGKLLSLPGEPPRVTMNGRTALLEDEVPPEADVLVIGGRDAQVTVADLFSAKGLNLPRPDPGAALVRVNGKEEAFTFALKDGDRVEILPQFARPKP